MNRRDAVKRLGVGTLLLALGAVASIIPGCGIPAATWITMGLNLIGTVLPTIPGIIAAISTLAGQQVLNQTQVQKLTQVFTGVQSLFQQAYAALNQYQANMDPTLITKIQDIVTQIKTQLSGVLANVQITDTATVAKITSIINAFTDLANNILVILPSVTAGKVTARRVSAAQLKRVTPEIWAAEFNAAAHKPSGSAVVDGAFGTVHAIPLK